MIITLEQAQTVDPKITQLDLNAYEQQIRALTNNNFNHKHIKVFNIGLVGDKVVTPLELVGVGVGDTIEVFNSRFNNGLYVVKAVSPFEITIDGEFVSEIVIDGGMSKVVYPDDIKVGLLDVIRYKQKMGNKLGVKSESVARMSTTYYDVSGVDNIDGMPSSQWSFLDKYRKIRW